MTAAMELASMETRDPAPRGRPESWVRRTAVAGIGAVVITALTASPVAADPNDVTDETWASRAAAHSLYLTAGGEIAGAEGYVAVHDGATEIVRGVTTPELPLISQQPFAMVGVLGQHAFASETGIAAACAGVVSRGGTVRVGADSGCLASGEGTIRISLGTLDHLGLGALVGGERPELPDLPVPVPGSPEAPVAEIPDIPVPRFATSEDSDLQRPRDDGTLPDLELPDLTELALPKLPSVELAVVGSAITARCLATPTKVDGATDIAHARVVAIVGDHQIPLADLPPEGLTLSLDQLLVALQNHLPGEVSVVLDQILLALPTEKLDDVRLLTIQVDARAQAAGQITVTALGVETAYPGLFDLALGTVTCATNRLAPPRKFPEAGPRTFAGANGSDEAAVTSDERAEPSAARHESVAKGATGGHSTATRRTAEGDTAERDAIASAELAPAASGSPVVPVGAGLVLAVVLAGAGVAFAKLRPRRDQS